MTEKQAVRLGYSFTGHYGRFGKKEEILEKAKSIRNTYHCRATVVTERDRGRTGYSVFADRKYFLLKRQCEVKLVLQDMPNRRARLTAEYEKGLQVLREEEEHAKDRLAEVEVELQQYE